jgi:hypothetical protein
MRTILSIIFSFLALFTIAQKRPPVKLLRTLAEIKYPGNIPIDDNGQPLRSGPDTSFTMIIETGKENIKWGKAYYNSHVYTVIATLLKPTGYFVKEKGSAKTLKFKAAKGNQLWRLELVPYDAYKKIPAGLNKDEFMLQLLYGKKSLRLVRKSFTEIEAPPSV